MFLVSRGFFAFPSFCLLICFSDCLLFRFLTVNFFDNLYPMPFFFIFTYTESSSMCVNNAVLSGEQRDVDPAGDRVYRLPVHRLPPRQLHFQEFLRH